MDGYSGYFLDWLSLVLYLFNDVLGAVMSMPVFSFFVGFLVFMAIVALLRFFFTSTKRL